MIGNELTLERGNAFRAIHSCEKEIAEGPMHWREDHRRLRVADLREIAIEKGIDPKQSKNVLIDALIAQEEQMFQEKIVVLKQRIEEINLLLAPVLAPDVEVIETVQEETTQEEVTMNEHKSLKCRKAYPRKLAKSVIDATFEELRIDREVVRCKAQETFVKGQVEVREGERFFIVRSETFKSEHRFYAVKWDDERLVWKCSCWKGARPHNHTQKASEHARALALKQKSHQEKKQPVQVSEAEQYQTLVSQKVAHNQETWRKVMENVDGGRSLTPEEWKAQVKREKAAKMAFAQSHQQSRQELREAAEKLLAS